MVAKQVTITSGWTKPKEVAGMLANHHQHLRDIDTTNEDNDNEPNIKHASRNASQCTDVVYGALSIALETHSAAHCERTKEVSSARQHDTDMVSTTWNLQPLHSDASETYTQVSGGANTNESMQLKGTQHWEAPCDEAATTHTNKNADRTVQEPIEQCDEVTTAQLEMPHARVHARHGRAGSGTRPQSMPHARVHARHGRAGSGYRPQSMPHARVHARRLSQTR